MNTQDLIAFLNRKSRHRATLASQATTSEVAFIHEDEAKRFAECAAQLAAAEQQLTTATALLGECERIGRDVIVCVERIPESEWLALDNDKHSPSAMSVTVGELTRLITRIREATKGKT